MIVVGFLISVFGIASVLRVADQSLHRLLPFASWPFYGSSCLALLVTSLCIFAFESPYILILGFGLVHFALFLLPRVAKHILNSILHEKSVQFLDIIVLSMKSGRSLRAAVSESVAEQSDGLKPYFQQVPLLLQNPSLKGSEQLRSLKILAREIGEIDRSNAKVLDQILAFRRQLKTELDLRRKANAASSQVRAQSLILAFLYLGLCAFISVQFGFGDNLLAFGISLVLFFCGLGGQHFLLKRFKWKT